MTDFVGDLRARGIPHIAVNGRMSKRGVVRKTAVDEATRSSDGHAISLRCRKPGVDASVTLAAFNLIGIPNLPARPAA